MKIRETCPICSSEINYRQPAVLMPFIAKRVFGWEKAYIDETWKINDIQNGELNHGCSTFFCDNCDFIFCDMGFDEDEMGRLYSDYRGELYNQQRMQLEPSYLLRSKALDNGYEYIPMIEEFIRSHSEGWVFNCIYDWGGDTGKNTPFIRSAKKIYINDISNKNNQDGIIEYVTSNSTLTNVDLFACLNVLEHLPFPRLELIRVLKYTKSKYFYFEVPCEKFLLEDGKPYTRNWRSKRHWHEHINCFTPTSLSKLVSSLGLDIIECKYVIRQNWNRDEHLIHCFAKSS